MLHRCRKGNRLNTIEEFEMFNSINDTDKKNNILTDKLNFKSHSIFISIVSN